MKLYDILEMVSYNEIEPKDAEDKIKAILLEIVNEASIGNSSVDATSTSEEIREEIGKM